MANRSYYYLLRKSIARKLKAAGIDSEPGRIWHRKLWFACHRMPYTESNNFHLRGYKAIIRKFK